ncbi:Na+/H+ antiporter subunit E [Aurantivibrio plasticivorans]
MHLGKWALLLAVFWLLLSGYFMPLMLGFGVLSVLIVLVLLARMDKVDGDPKHIGTGHRMVRYSLWLIWQIVLSSLQVTRLVWAPTSKLSPSLEKIPVSIPEETKRVIYANSITLTPGTLSVDLEDGEVTVHALQKESIDELKTGSMESKITTILGSKA